MAKINNSSIVTTTGDKLAYKARTRVDTTVDSTYSNLPADIAKQTVNASKAKQDRLKKTKEKAKRRAKLAKANKRKNKNKQKHHNKYLSNTQKDLFVFL